MKKIFFSLIYILLFENVLVANFPNGVPITPKWGGGGVNLVSNAYVYSNDMSYADNPKDVPAAGGQYSEVEIIAHGGIFDSDLSNTLQNMGKLDVSDMVDNPIYLTINCPGGFFFVSQSNSTYKVPFQLAVVQRYHKTTLDWEEYGFGKRRNIIDFNEDSTKDIYVVSDYNSTCSLSYDTNMPNDKNIIQEREWGLLGDWVDTNSTHDATVNHSSWFDIVLILPGQLNSDKTAIEYDGKEYPILPGDDYAASVTITMRWKDYTGSITIPFSGYIPDSFNTGANPMQASSLYLQPTGASANLNLKTDYNRWITIANISYQNYVRSSNTKPAYLFASANSSPFVQDTQGFMLVHEDSKLTATPDADEKVTFKIKIVDQNGKSEEFLGKDYVSDTGITKSLSTTSTTRQIGQGEHTVYEFNGRMDIFIEQPLENMKKGRYEDEVFLHVVSQNTAAST